MGTVLLAGGFGAAAALLLGLAFATSAARVIALGALGAALACAAHVVLGADDPLVRELVNASATANALGWLAGTLLVGRLRALEWLHAQEAA